MCAWYNVGRGEKAQKRALLRQEAPSCLKKRTMKPERTVKKKQKLLKLSVLPSSPKQQDMKAERTLKKRKLPKALKKRLKTEFWNSILENGDVQFVTDDAEECVKGHRAVMVANSPFFRYLLEADSLKKEEEPIRIPDLKHKELKCLVHFMHSGILREEAVNDEPTLHSLYLASHKYGVPFLMQSCESCIIQSLNEFNVLRVLELLIPAAPSRLKDAALDRIAANPHIVFSEEYELIALINPVLQLEITRALAKFCLL